MKIKQVNLILNDFNMQDKECNFKIVSKKKAPPEWFTTYMDKFEKRINARFDNLIKKNNLIE
ncbi:MAG: hypothetical protein KBS35_01610 [Mycoplasma sp.]|nr:hypothetical protein [Candidatus Hennigella equi]